MANLNCLDECLNRKRNLKNRMFPRYSLESKAHLSIVIINTYLYLFYFLFGTYYVNANISFIIPLFVLSLFLNFYLVINYNLTLLKNTLMPYFFHHLNNKDVNNVTNNLIQLNITMNINNNSNNNITQNMLYKFTYFINKLYTNLQLSY